jgi:hypothetical protein
MPRLGVDAHRNLLLVWTLAKDPAPLVYQRYRGDTQTWGEIQLIPEVALFENTGPLSVAANGLAGTVFRDLAESSLELAQFL